MKITLQLINLTISLTLNKANSVIIKMFTSALGDVQNVFSKYPCIKSGTYDLFFQLLE